MNKKIFTSFSTISAITISTTTIISCGVTPPTSDQIFVKDKLGSSAAGNFANKFYLNSLAEYLYKNKKADLLAEQKKAWSSFVSESLRKDDTFFAKQITKWVAARILQWDDSKAPLLDVPKISRELSYLNHHRDATENLLTGEKAFKSITEAKDTGMAFMLNQMVIAKNLLIGEKTVDQLKKSGVDIKPKQDSLYILDNKKEHKTQVNNYYFIKWMVENHPMFAWKESFDKLTQSNIDMAKLDTWNGQDRTSWATNSFHTLSKSSLFNVDPVVSLDKMYGYQGLVSSLEGTGSTGRFDTSISSLRSYTKNWITQGFVQFLGKKGALTKTITIEPTAKGKVYNPLNDGSNVLMAYVIQMLPKWDILKGAKEYNEEIEAKDWKQEKKDKKKHQEGYFQLPDFKNKEKDVLLYAMIAKNLPSLITQAKNFWTKNGFAFETKQPEFKKTIDNQGISNQK